jgi:enoyl-[acyl-carrier-protein] reductase (NADH)
MRHSTASDLFGTPVSVPFLIGTLLARTMVKHRSFAVKTVKEDWRVWRNCDGAASGRDYRCVGWRRPGGACAFARRGASVGLIARGRAGLQAAKRDVETLGGRAVIAAADVANADQVEAAAETIERALGPIDVWVNNAMTSVFSPVKEMTADEFHRVTEVTYLGVVYGTLAALRRMLPRNRGSIVQVGSALAYRGIPLQAAYCGTKHAI